MADGSDDDRYGAEHALDANSHLDPPDGPSPLGWAGSSCTFCESSETVWQHDLNAARASFRTLFGKGTIWGGAQPLCQRCEDLYDAGEYAQLARLKTSDPPAYDDELADNLAALAAFARADCGPRLLLPRPDFPEGFRPIAELTGMVEVFDAWPAEHRLIVPDTGRPGLDHDPDTLIRAGRLALAVSLTGRRLTAVVALGRA